MSPLASYLYKYNLKILIYYWEVDARAFTLKYALMLLREIPEADPRTPEGTLAATLEALAMSSEETAKSRGAVAPLRGPVAPLRGPVALLPEHSYWFDMWLFVVFDVLFFLFMLFVVP